ncbi:TadE/TadG family type IV pilus assembly protein [Tabrizicola sp.]|uniref:TadE/TadG family type IV pilus assembly protein n=1 Tax=Tabrizicola sp. TaxID=2005166 RepID=UPI003D2CD19C
MQRALKRFAKSQDGAVAIEMAIIAPVLLILLIAAVNLGAKIVEKARLDQATREVVEATLFTTNRLTLQTALNEALTKLGNPISSAPYAGTVVSICRCGSNQVQNCVPSSLSACAVAGGWEVLFLLTASTTFNPILPIPNVFVSEEISSQRTIQVR